MQWPTAFGLAALAHAAVLLAALGRPPRADEGESMAPVSVRVVEAPRVSPAPTVALPAATDAEAAVRKAAPAAMAAPRRADPPRAAPRTPPPVAAGLADSAALPRLFATTATVMPLAVAVDRGEVLLAAAAERPGLVAAGGGEAGAARGATGAGAASGSATGSGAGSGGGSAAGSGTGPSGAGDGVDVRRLIGERIRAHRRYPTLAQRRGVEGTVWLTLAIHRDGSVDVKVARGADPALDEAAKEAALDAAPLPFVDGLVEVPLTFRLLDE